MTTHTRDLQDGTGISRLQTRNGQAGWSRAGTTRMNAIEVEEWNIPPSPSLLPSLRLLVGAAVFGRIREVIKGMDNFIYIIFIKYLIDSR